MSVFRTASTSQEKIQHLKSVLILFPSLKSVVRSFFTELARDIDEQSAANFLAANARVRKWQNQQFSRQKLTSFLDKNYLSNAEYVSMIYLNIRIMSRISICESCLFDVSLQHPRKERRQFISPWCHMFTLVSNCKLNYVLRNNANLWILFLFLQWS